MLRPTPLLLSYVLFASAVSSHAQTSTPVDVLYLQQNATILTYDVNPQTAEATEVGQPLVIDTPYANLAIVPAPNDHSLNILWMDASNKQRLWVYDTETSGAPQAQPLQKLSVTSVSQFLANPNGKFDYVLGRWQNSSGEYLENIRLFIVDPITGKLTESPQVQASFGPNYYFTAALFGFNSSGSELYDTWNVNFDAEAASTYDSRTVNSETGTLGTNVEIFYWSDFVSSDQVLLTNNLIIDLSIPSENVVPQSINIYPLVKNSTTPEIVCNTAMLAACGSAQRMALDPSGKYLFLNPNYPLLTSDNVTHIAKIDLASKQIVDTGHSIPGSPQIFFSGDGRLVYAVNLVYEGTGTIQIYKFDKTDGVVTPGEQISQPALINVSPAERRQ
jgi:hypothetical protein